MNSGTDNLLYQDRAAYARRFSDAYRETFGVEYVSPLAGPLPERRLPPEQKYHYDTLKVKLPSGKKVFFGCVNGRRLRRPLKTRTLAYRYAPAVMHRLIRVAVSNVLTKPDVTL